MTQQNLPAFLASRAKPSIAKTIVQNFGTSMPPHISIRGNRFTLVDGAGNERPVETLHLDVVIVDLNDKMTKVYYPDMYDPNERLPPTCYSDNGVGPSSRAQVPQAPTCAVCPNSKWGSATSKITGKPIPACANGIKLAVIVPNDPGKLCYMLRVPPNSIAAVKGYAKMMGDQPDYDVVDVITRVTFEAGVQGTLEFKPIALITEEIAGIQTALWEANATGFLVGKDDVPYQGALPAPAQQPAGALAPPPPSQGQAQQQPAPAPATQPPLQEPGFMQPPPSNGAAMQPAPPKRGRRPNAPAQQPAQQPAAPPPQHGGLAPQQPAFLAPQQPQQPAFLQQPTAAPAAPTAPNTFGMTSATAPNPELDAALQKVFALPTG